MQDGCKVYMDSYMANGLCFIVVIFKDHLLEVGLIQSQKIMLTTCMNRSVVQNHVVWSWILKCSVKPYATGPSTKCYFNEFIFKHVLTHDKMKYINACEHLECHGLPIMCLGLPPRGGI